MEQRKAKEGRLAPRSRGVCDLGHEPPCESFTDWSVCLGSPVLQGGSNQSSPVERPGFFTQRTWVLATNLPCDLGQATCPLGLSFLIWNIGTEVSGCWLPLVTNTMLASGGSRQLPCSTACQSLNPTHTCSTPASLVSHVNRQPTSLKQKPQHEQESPRYQSDTMTGVNPRCSGKKER